MKPCSTYQFKNSEFHLNDSFIFTDKWIRWFNNWTAAQVWNILATFFTITFLFSLFWGAFSFFSFLCFLFDVFKDNSSSWDHFQSGELGLIVTIPAFCFLTYRDCCIFWHALVKDGFFPLPPYVVLTPPRRQRLVQWYRRSSHHNTSHHPKRCKLKWAMTRKEMPLLHLF